MTAEPWAKTDETGQTRSVIEHCTDVALMARAMLVRPVLRQRLGAAFGVALTHVHLDRLAVLAGLHDLGKTLRGFQSKLIEKPMTISSGHTGEILAALMAKSAVQEAARCEILDDWFDAGTALFTSICHHGQPLGDDKIAPHLALVSEQLRPTETGLIPIVEMRRLADAMLQRFPLALQPAARLDFLAPAQHLYAGVVMAADWMASGFTFTDGERAELATSLLADTGWDGWHSHADARAILGTRAPRAAQAALLDASIDERLLVVEAPTGTGKSEAAMIWASRLTAAGKVDGLYFAVPSRSAATELHKRVARTLGDVHPALRGLVVRAVPGVIDTDVRPDYAPEPWSIGAPKRCFAAPVAVGTIDQAMLSMLRVRHAWLRAALLSRHLLVIDEVHASDPYMARIIRELAHRHLGLGGYVLAMSATLGETALADLQGKPRRSFGEACSVPYPALRGTSDVPLSIDSERDVAIDTVSPTHVITAATEACRMGAAVLLIRSTVTDAVATYLELQQAGIETLLHHGRYALHDRTLLDDRLLGILGPSGTRKPIVIVATQTAEQSLDIDADLLITDACPADVLLQRLGRLHRHRTGTKPTALVINPGNIEQYIDPKGQPRGRPGQGWAWVYRNLLAVDQTMSFIRLRGRIVTPRDCRELVESATHVDHLREIAEERGGLWTLLWRTIYGDAAMKEQLGAAGLVDWSRPYADAVINDRFATRLGDGTIDIMCSGLRSPFDGAAIDCLPIPARWLRDIADTEVAQVDGDRITVGAVALRYDATGLHRL